MAVEKIIFVVDDDAMVAAVLQDAIRSFFENDAGAASELISVEFMKHGTLVEFPPRACLLVADLQMPYFNGIDWAVWALFYSVPTICISGDTNVSSTLSELGIVCLSKPVFFDILQPAVKGAIEGPEQHLSAFYRAMKKMSETKPNLYPRALDFFKKYL